MNLLSRANEFYNTKFEQAVSASIFAVGGICAGRIRKKVGRWLRGAEGVVLDIGSGDGKWRGIAARARYYAAIDYAPAAASCPWRRFGADVNADAHHLPVKNGAADAVLNIAVLEHVRDPAQVLREMARALRPGGRLVLLGPGDALATHGEPHHYFNITIHGYRELMRQAGIRIVEEYFPQRSAMSIMTLAYLKIVRNNAYNRHWLLKLVQVPVFLFSLLLSPPVNILALLLDAVIPFDNRIYSLVMIHGVREGDR